MVQPWLVRSSPMSVWISGSSRSIVLGWWRPRFAMSGARCGTRDAGHLRAAGGDITRLTREPLPASRKVYVEGSHPGVRVADRNVRRRK